MARGMNTAIPKMHCYADETYLPSDHRLFVILLPNNGPRWEAAASVGKWRTQARRAPLSCVHYQDGQSRIAFGCRSHQKSTSAYLEGTWGYRLSHISDILHAYEVIESQSTSPSGIA
ncbi:hypothetical protein AWENTII_003275 [Aspergillus wentii]